MTSADVDEADVQGIVRFGHGKLTEACFLLLQIADRPAARSWLATAKITSAADPPSPAAMPTRARNMKRLPTSGMLSTQTCPAIISTSRLQMARPRPVPPNLRVIEPSACTNGSKIV